MWEFFKRLFRIFKSEANSLADKLENPIKMAKQGIRDLKEDLDASIKSFAEIKAMAIRERRKLAELERTTKDYERKAVALLKAGQSGKMTAEEADRLASEALKRKDETQKLLDQTRKNSTQYDKSEDQMGRKIQTLKREIAKWDTQLKSMEARLKAAKAGEKINKALAGMDSNKTLEMLKKTKDRVEQAEAESEAYGEMIDTTKSVDQEIDDALDHTGQSDALLEMKRKLGMMPKVEIASPEAEKVKVKVEVEEREIKEKATIKINLDGDS